MPDEDFLNCVLDGIYDEEFSDEVKQNVLFMRRVKVRKKAEQKSKI